MEAIARLLVSKVLDWLFRDQGTQPVRGVLPGEKRWQVVAYPRLNRYEHWRSILLDPPTAVYKDPFTNATLYLGSSFNAADYHGLRQRGVWHVVNVTQCIPNFHVGINYIRVPARDVEGARLFFNEGHAFHVTVRFIHDCLCAGKSVLVHCFAGSSRSAAVVLLYLMWRRHYLTLVGGYDDLVRQRPCVAVNRRFLLEVKRLVPALHRHTHRLARALQIRIQARLTSV